jgi:hypothetical protein
LWVTLEEILEKGLISFLLDSSTGNLKVNLF